MPCGLRGEIAGVIAAQRHDPGVKKMVAELSEKTGEAPDEIMDRALGRARDKFLPEGKPITTTTPPASNAAVTAFRDKLEK